jgi:glyoxylase-like metal-dependent hydrolase (beta-lactamase superfamily II)
MTSPLYRSRPGGFDIKPASQSEARRIAEGIYVSEGLSNSYLVVTSEGRVVINTGMGFEAPIHKRNYDAISSAPIRYILLTQGHVDHDRLAVASPLRTRSKAPCDTCRQRGGRSPPNPIRLPA